jgi:predicted nuclease of predicted toxin-antitoxin system
MHETIRFHLDENVNHAIADGLRRRKIDVSTTPESGLISASDEEQLRFARNQGRVVFTQDSDFLKLHNAGLEHCGIVYCVKTSRSIGEILQGLILIWEVLEAEEISGKVEFLS